MSAQLAINFNVTVAPAAEKRLGRHHQAILAALREGPRTNWELAKVGGLRFGARLEELRSAGHRISTHRVSEERGVFMYRLEEI